MKPMTTKIGFDCLAFKQVTQEKMAQDMQKLSHLEQIEYLNGKIDESDFKMWWDAVKNR